MGEIICRFRYMWLLWNTLVSCALPGQPAIICDAAHVITHNKCAQRVAVLAPPLVHCIFHLRFIGEWVQCPINQTNAIGEHKFLLDPLCNCVAFIIVWQVVVFAPK